MRLRHLALPAAAGLTLLAVPFAPAALAAAPECDPSANTCSALFEYSGGAQSFTVPAGVSNLAVAIGGASGGDGLEEDGSPQGGQGGGLTAIVPVSPGEVLTLLVGSKGGNASLTSTTAAPGGYGGGGAGTAATNGSLAGGGGGSFLFGSDGLLIAAGGGGGAGLVGADGTDAAGGNGGATSGGAGQPSDLGGLGATAGSAGGAGGGDDAAGGNGPAAAPNSLGRGGAAAGTCAAGGGGGGYFGGGSGGCDTTPPADTAKAAAGVKLAAKADATIYRSGGGGGGSGFAAAGVSLVETDLTTGLDNGVISVAYTTAASTTTIATDVTTLAPGQEATINATVDGPDLTIVGDDAEQDSPAVAAAAKAFGASAAAAVKAKGVAVPTTPAPAGTTLNPGTACGSTPCTVTFYVNGEQLVDPIEIDPATGVASVIFTAGSEEGVREITARYDGNLYYLQSASGPITITVAGLANTGPSNVAPLLVTSTLLLAAGAGLVAFGRRRPQLGSHRAA